MEGGCLHEVFWERRRGRIVFFVLDLQMTLGYKIYYLPPLLLVKTRIPKFNGSELNVMKFERFG